MTVQKSVVLELVGPPGSGKSTLVSKLSGYSHIQLAPSPFYRDLRYLPFFAQNTLSMLPVFINLYRNRNGRWLTREEIAWLVILHGWHRLLQKQKTAQSKYMLIDQGPVFFLYWLYGFGSAIIKDQYEQPWWREMIKQWAKTLNSIVWLDATNDALMARINSREASHRIKGKSILEVESFFDKTRKALNYVISEFFTQNTNLKVLYFNTTQTPPLKLAEDLLNTTRTLF